MARIKPETVGLAEHTSVTQLIETSKAESYTTRQAVIPRWQEVLSIIHLYDYNGQSEILPSMGLSTRDLRRRHCSHTGVAKLNETITFRPIHCTSDSTNTPYMAIAAGMTTPPGRRSRSRAEMMGPLATWYKTRHQLNIYSSLD